MFLLLFYFLSILSSGEFRLPVDGHSPELTEIGQFGTYRKARPGIPGHLHAGIDIKRPGTNYEDEPIYPIAEGQVISKREDGPYAQLIIKHQVQRLTFWCVYEHISGIEVNLYDLVTPGKPLARFFNREELNRYGWQFDHFHFEILKQRPVKIEPSLATPDRYFRSYTLECFTREKLEEYFYDPLEFLF